MNIAITDINDSIRCITLSGRLDTSGVDEVETRFTAAIVPTGKSAVVDLSDVEFIASMGIRMFIAVARSLSGKTAQMALFSPQELVNEVFETVSLTDIVPICRTQDEAVAMVTS